MWCNIRCRLDWKKRLVAGCLRDSCDLNYLIYYEIYEVVKVTASILQLFIYYLSRVCILCHDWFSKDLTRISKRGVWFQLTFMITDTILQNS